LLEMETKITTCVFVDSELLAVKSDEGFYMRAMNEMDPRNRLDDSGAKFANVPLLRRKAVGYNGRVVILFEREETLFNGAVEIREEKLFTKRPVERILIAKVGDLDKEGVTLYKSGLGSDNLLNEVICELLFPSDPPKKFEREATGVFAGRSQLGVVYEGKFYAAVFSEPNPLSVNKMDCDLGISFGKKWPYSIAETCRSVNGVTLPAEDGKIFVHKPTYKKVPVGVSSVDWRLELGKFHTLNDTGYEVIESKDDFEAFPVDKGGCIVVDGEKVGVESDNYVVRCDGKFYNSFGQEIEVDL
jgi:hypothetical protein